MSGLLMEAKRPGVSPVSYVEELGKLEYAKLVDIAKDLAEEIGVDQKLASNTFYQLECLRSFDEQTARESLQTLPLAIMAGKATDEFYGGNTALTLQNLWAAALCHDVGKVTVGEDLIRISNEGKLSWVDNYVINMMPHASNGEYILRLCDFSDGVSRPVGTHHQNQEHYNYGSNPNLNEEERLTRDAICIADFMDAIINRTNSRNAELSVEERFQKAKEHIQYVFDGGYGKEPYKDKEALAEYVYNRLTN